MRRGVQTSGSFRRRRRRRRGSSKRMFRAEIIGASRAGWSWLARKRSREREKSDEGEERGKRDVKRDRGTKVEHGIAQKLSENERKGVDLGGTVLVKRDNLRSSCNSSVMPLYRQALASIRHITGLHLCFLPCVHWRLDGRKERETYRRLYRMLYTRDASRRN